MSGAQYQQYLNLHIFAKDWRKYKQKQPPLDKNKFRTSMMSNSYVELKYAQPRTGRPVNIYLLAKNNPCSRKVDDLRKLLVKNKEPSDVILVSDEKFKVHPKNEIKSKKFSHLNVSCYLHENFMLVVPKGPSCYPHRIMSSEEVNELMNNGLMRSDLHDLPKILKSDVQCIWIGADIGDVIEITVGSDIIGEVIQYRLVIEESGTNIVFDETPDLKELDDDDIDEAEIKSQSKNKSNVKSKFKSKSKAKNKNVESDDDDDIDVDDDIKEYREDDENNYDVSSEDEDDKSVKSDK